MEDKHGEYITVARNKIKQHAINAISALEHQLITAKSPVKIAKLKYRILAWKKSLDLLDHKNDKTKNK